MSRKRQHPSGGSLPGPHPHTISRLSELLETCTDAQYKDIIKRLPEDWSATNDKGITVTKRQLEMAQWGAYKDAVLDNMGFPVPFSTVGNGLWEMNKWEMGVGWLRWIRGFGSLG
jgi:hypothetical protein